MKLLMPQAVSCWALLAMLSIGHAALAADEPQAPSNPQAIVLSEVGIDQNLDAQLPLDLKFRNEQGDEVRLGDYFGERPVILALVYYQCPQLCNQVLNGVCQTLKAVDFEPGEDYELVVVSFDPTEEPDLAAAKKRSYLHRLNREGGEQGWHFLVGEQPEIEALAKTVGFRYEYNEKSKQYAHASGITIATPSGRLARYFYGIDYPPRDVRLGLIEASTGKIGSPVDVILLFCYHYDPTTGKYGLAILRLIQVAGALTVFGLGAFIVVALRTEKKTQPNAPSEN